MRTILGDIGDPGSAYVLVCRGIDENTADFVRRHAEKFPHWGVLVFPELSQTTLHGTFSPSKGIHRIYGDFTRFNSFSDRELIQFVLKEFPPYMEDYPVIPEISVPPLEFFERTGRFETLCVDYMFEPHEVYTLLSAGKLHSSPDEIVKEYVNRLKREILAKVFNSKKFWKIETPPIDGSPVKISVRLDVGVNSDL